MEGQTFMSSRVIRQGLLSSEAVAGLHDRTFRLYLGLILRADDFGLVEIGYGPIKESHALLEWTREIVAKMLGELTDARLILPYQVGPKRYAAIDRWEATIKSHKPQHPIPGFGLVHVRKVYWFKDVQTKIAASLYLKHLSLDSELPSAPLVPPQLPPRAPLGNEEVRGKRIKNKEGTHDLPRVSLMAHPNVDLLGYSPWECPDGIEPEAWNDWLKVRKRKKAENSERAYASVMNKIEAIRKAGLNPTDFVDKSARSGWSDIYPPEAPPSSATKSGNGSSSFGAFDTTGTMPPFPPPKA